MLLIDGGVAWNLDVASAITKCREIVTHDSKIVLDVIDVDMFQDHLPSWRDEKGELLLAK